MRRITALVMAVLLGVVLAACGGDDSTASTDTTASSDDGGTTGDDGGDTDGSDEDLDLGFIDDDCEFLVAAFANNPLTAAMAGDDADYEENAARLEALADDAPDEIEDAMATISDAFDEMAEALKDIDMSDPQAFADPDVQQAFADLEPVFDEEYEEASQTVSDYAAENCSGS
jgi:hypothetical protein